MKKIIPVLSLIISVAALSIAVIGLVTICVSVSARGLDVLAVPVILVGAVISSLSSVTCFMFRRDMLCRIAFFIGLGAFIVSAVSVIVWLSAF